MKRSNLRKADGSVSTAVGRKPARMAPESAGSGAKGEGSRGGKVIGHDTQGKAQYARSDPGAGSAPEAMQQRSPEEHAQAARMMEKMAQDHAAAGNADKAQEMTAAAKQYRQANPSSAQAEPTRVVHAAQIGNAQAKTSATNPGAQQGTQAGRKQVTPQSRGQSTPEGKPDSELSEPGDGQDSATVAKQVHETGVVGKTSSGREVKLGADTQGWNPAEMHEAAEMHRGAQLHLLQAAKDTGNAEYRKTARKHLDEEFKITSDAVDAGSTLSADDKQKLGKPMQKSKSWSPLAAWARHPRTLMKSTWMQSLNPFASLEAMDALLKAEQGDLFSGAKSAAPKQAATGRSGEGSRGGHVIGHTSSGKPIYQDHGHEAHADFSAADHASAAQVHRAAAKNTEVGLHGKQSEHHNAQAAHHDAQGKAMHAVEKTKIAAQHTMRAADASAEANKTNTVDAHSHARAMHLAAMVSQAGAGHNELARAHEADAGIHEARATKAPDYAKTKTAAEAHESAKRSSSIADKSGTAAAHELAMHAHAKAAELHGSGTMADGHREAAAHHQGEAAALRANATKKPTPPKQSKGQKLNVALQDHARAMSEEAHSASRQANMLESSTSSDIAARKHKIAAAAWKASGAAPSTKAAKVDEHNEHASIHQKQADKLGADNVAYQKNRAAEAKARDANAFDESASKMKTRSGKTVPDHPSDAKDFTEQDHNDASYWHNEQATAAATMASRHGDDDGKQYEAQLSHKGHAKTHQKMAEGARENAKHAVAGASKAGAKASKSHVDKLHGAVASIKPEKLKTREHFEQAHAKIKALGDHIEKKLGMHPATAHARKAGGLADMATHSMGSSTDKASHRHARAIFGEAQERAKAAVDALPEDMKNAPTLGHHEEDAAKKIQKSAGDLMDDLAQTLHNEAHPDALEKSRMKTDMQQPKRGKGKKAKVKGGKRSKIANDTGNPSPGKTTHLNPPGVQGALTKSVTASSFDVWAAAHVDDPDRYRHRPRLNRPRQETEVYLGNVPMYGAAPEPVRLEKSQAVALAKQAVDIALVKCFTTATLAAQGGTLEGERLLKSVMPGRAPMWTEQQRNMMRPRGPDTVDVVRGAADLLKSLAAVDLDARLGLAELGVSEASLMGRLVELQLSAASVSIG